MIPSNPPSSEPRRLLRRSTGRATPLADRVIMTAEERNRIRERQQAKENSLEQGFGNNHLQHQQRITSSLSKSANDDSSNNNNASQIHRSVLDISDPFISDKKVVAASLVDNNFGSNYNVLKRTNAGARVHSVYVVSLQDPRALWLDPSHKSERRNDHSIRSVASVTKHDIKYVRERDTYVPADNFIKSSVARNHYTDAERLALSNLQKSKELMMGSSSSISNDGAISSSSAASASRQRTSPPRNRASSSIGMHSDQQQQKSLAQIYHERLNHLSNTPPPPPTRKSNQQQQPTITPFSSFHDLQRTSGNMQHQIADATRNFFGGRHAPSATQAAIQQGRDSAARLLHGDNTNTAGHHELFNTTSSSTSMIQQQQFFKNQEIDDRRKTRAIQWKQEREVRNEFTHERRETVAAKQEAIEKTKHERSCARVKDPERDVDYFLRREKGPRIVKECSVRSENSKMGNWLFDYPKKN